MSKSKINPALVQELLEGGVFADEKGYWKARGHKADPGLAWKNDKGEVEMLPFAEFFENLSDSEGEGHKKMWLNPDGSVKQGRMTDTRETLMPLYRGIVLTNQRIVSLGYAMYSALVVQLHLQLAYWSRKLDCNADVKSVFKTGDEKAIQDITSRAVALRVAAFIIYEGDGLGGYKPKAWKLYGRLFGMSCPTDGRVLSSHEAQEAEKDYAKASDGEKAKLFARWFKEVHSEIDDPAVLARLHGAYRLVCRYRRMEAPTCPKKEKFNASRALDRQAALVGFFRRSAQGIGEAKAYDANAGDANRFSDMIFKAEDKILPLLVGRGGEYTAFGNYLRNLFNIHELRNELVDKITARENLPEEKKKRLSKLGFKSRVSKRGAARV